MRVVFFQDSHYELLTDATHKLSERRILLVQPDSDPKAAAIPKPKTNALLTLVSGFPTAHYTTGSAEKKSGGLKKYRSSFNQLAISFRRGGEATSAFASHLRAPIAFAEQYRPNAVARLKQPSAVTCDFASGCIEAYNEVFKADKNNDRIVFQACIVKRSCLIATC